MWTISGWLEKTTLKYFLDINLISPKQSRFRPGDSCVNQFWQTRKAAMSFNGLFEKLSTKSSFK